MPDVCWLTRETTRCSTIEATLRAHFHSLEVLYRVPPGGIDSKVVAFDVDMFSTRQLLKFRKMYDGGIIAVYTENPPESMVRILEHGVDDCLSAREDRLIVSRIKSLLRHSFIPVNHGHLICRKGWQFDKRSLVVTMPGGARLNMTELQAKLFGCLLQHEGQIVTRNFISHDVYGETLEYGNRKVDMAIATLRRKIAKHTDQGRIVTVSSRGYLLTLDEPG